MMKIKILILSSLFFGSFAWAQDEYTIIYEADLTGKRISGNLDGLFAYMETGNPIRVGWMVENENDSNKIEEHWVGANFLTMVNGIIYAQISFISKRGTKFSELNNASNFLESRSYGWIAIVNSSGLIQQSFKEILYRKDGISQKALDRIIETLDSNTMSVKWAAIKE